MKVELISFLKHIKSKNFFDIKKRILVAVSGGIDSMVLLHLMQQSDYQIAVGHIDHLTRNGQSTQDAIFLENYCKNYGIEFHKSEFIDNQDSGNFHNKAHKFRYHFFNSLGFDYTLTAHHYDDNIETIFLNFLNGKSTAGIPEVNKNIVRPLLIYTKKSIKEYAEINDVKYVEDKSNLSNSYDRNFIRNKVIPLLKSRNTDTDEKITNLSSRNKLDEILLSSLVAEKLNLIIDHNSISIPKHSIGDNSTLLYHAVKSYGYNRSQARDMIKAIDNTGSIFYSPDYCLVIDRDVLLLKEKEEDNTDVSYVSLDELPLTIRYLDYNFRFERTSFIDTKSSNILYTPISLLHETIRIRTWKEGDYFCPTGMKGHSKTLKKFFTDTKINRLEKHRIPLLISGDDIIWVCGYRSDQRYQVKPIDSDFLKVTILS
jgi:tRNA(Ile)-lysidine synthase